MGPHHERSTTRTADSIPEDHTTAPHPGLRTALIPTLSCVDPPVATLDVISPPQTLPPEGWVSITMRLLSFALHKWPGKVDGAQHLSRRGPACLRSPHHPHLGHTVHFRFGSPPAARISPPQPRMGSRRRDLEWPGRGRRSKTPRVDRGATGFPLRRHVCVNDHAAPDLDPTRC